MSYFCITNYLKTYQLKTAFIISVSVEQECVNSSVGWFLVSVSYNFAVGMSAWAAVIWKLVSSWRIYFQALSRVDRKPQSICWLLVGWLETSVPCHVTLLTGQLATWQLVSFKISHPGKRESKVKACLFMTLSLKYHTTAFTVFFYHKWITKSILTSKSREAKREEKQRVCGDYFKTTTVTNIFLFVILLTMNRDSLSSYFRI